LWLFEAGSKTTCMGYLLSNLISGTFTVLTVSEKKNASPGKEKGKNQTPLSF